jgi:cytochrome P450
MAAARGNVTDLLGAYARLLPITVLCELLGIPVADRAWIAVTVAAYDERAEHQRVERELAAYFTELIATKRAGPGDDLVSELTLACDNADGSADKLTGNELLSTIFLLVMAGFDTTVNLIASGALALLAHPGEKTRLRQDPSLLPAAVEELLRFTSPVNHANDRFTTQDVRVGDVVIPACEWVLPWPAWRPRSPSAPCSPASREYCSRSPGGTPLASRQPHERPGLSPGPHRLTGSRTSAGQWRRTRPRRTRTWPDSRFLLLSHRLKHGAS